MCVSCCLFVFFVWTVEGDGRDILTRSADSTQPSPVAQFLSVALAQQLALEITATLCSQEDDEQQQQADEWIDDDDVADVLAAESAAAAAAAGGGGGVSERGVETAVLQAIVAAGLCQRYRFYLCVSWVCVCVCVCVCVRKCVVVVVCVYHVVVAVLVSDCDPNIHLLNLGAVSMYVAAGRVVTSVAGARTAE